MNTYIFLQGRAAGAWRGGFAQRLTAAAVLGFCLVASRLPAPAPPTPDPGDYIYLQLSAYDLDGRAGLKRIYEEGVEGVWTKVYLGGSTTPTYSWNEMGNFYRSSELLSQAGTLFRFTVEHPRLGLFEGTAKVGETGPQFVIPVTQKEMNTSVFAPAFSSSYPDYCYVDLSIYALGNESRLGCAHRLSSLDNLANPIDIRIEYLPGNTLEHIERQSFSIPRDPLHSSFISFRWGGGTPNPQYPSSVKIGEIAPIGPVKISMHVDGYSTDTLTIIAENYHAYYWNPLVYSIDAPNPNVLYPQYSFQQIDNITTPTLTPGQTATPNVTESPAITITATSAPTSTSISPTASPNPTTSPAENKSGILWVLR